MLQRGRGRESMYVEAGVNVWVCVYLPKGGLRCASQSMAQMNQAVELIQHGPLTSRSASSSSSTVRVGLPLRV